MTEIFYSCNDEWLSAGSIEEAYQGFIDANYVGEDFAQFAADFPKITIYSANFVQHSASYYFPHGSELIEMAAERPYDVCVETNGWLEKVSTVQTDELSAAIDKVVNAWADRHNLHPRFWQSTGSGKEIVVRPLTDTTCEVIV